MSSWTALTTLPSRAAADLLAETADEVLDPAPFGTGVFEIEDGSDRWEVGCYFTDAPDEIALALLARAAGAQPFAVSEVPETDWVAHVKRELSPVHAGRFFVHGAHDADRVPADAEPLLIEAAMAFGTGHHATTRGCLEALEAVSHRSPGHVADIGCGTAVLAMAAARLWPGAEVLASDNDPIAVDTARANAAANGLAARVDVLEAAGMDHPGLGEGPLFDVLLANILKQPLIDLAPVMAERLAPGGVAILSGILSEQSDAVEAVWTQLGGKRHARNDQDGWATLVMTRD